MSGHPTSPQGSLRDVRGEPNPSPGKPRRTLRERRETAICGGVATAPLVAGIIGWASHWNAYTNLTLTLGAAVLWLTLDKVFVDAARD